MGDRAEVTLTNFYADTEGRSIVLYTHWGGYRLPMALQEALAHGRGRWGDDTYLARIVVSQIVGDRWDEETGFGLAPFPVDTEYQPLTVYLHEQEVSIGERVFSFDDFLALPEDELKRLWLGGGECP